MVVEIEFLGAELAAENKVIERLLLSQSILHDERLCSYKSPSGKVSAEGGVCGNRSINYCDKSVNTNETPLGQNQFIESNLVNDYIDVGTILLEMMKFLRQPMRLLIQILMICYAITLNI